MSDPLLDVQNLSLRFGGIHAIDGVSFSVPAGELLAIVGPNGAGKTSLLNCISGVYRATDGVIRYQGVDVTGSPAHKAAGMGIARTFQHLELFPHLTVLENLMLGRQARLSYGLAAAGLHWGRARHWEIAQRAFVEGMAEFFELEPYRNRQVADLPYGIQKVIGLARAFAAEPRLVLLDEPGAGLNRQEKEDIARFLTRARHETRPTIVWIEHDMQLVRDLADRVLVLHYGKELACGPPDAVLSDPRVVEAYLGGRSTRRASQAI